MSGDALVLARWSGEWFAITGWGYFLLVLFAAWFSPHRPWKRDE